MCALTFHFSQTFYKKIPWVQKTTPIPLILWKNEITAQNIFNISCVPRVPDLREIVQKFERALWNPSLTLLSRRSPRCSSSCSSSTKVFAGSGAAGWVPSRSCRSHCFCSLISGLAPVNLSGFGDLGALGRAGQGRGGQDRAWPSSTSGPQGLLAQCEHGQQVPWPVWSL